MLEQAAPGSRRAFTPPLAPLLLSSEHDPAIVLHQHLRPLAEDQMGSLPLHQYRPLDKPAPLGEDDRLDLHQVPIHRDGRGEVISGEVCQEPFDRRFVCAESAAQARPGLLQVADDPVVVVGVVPELVELLALDAQEGELEEALRRPVGGDLAKVVVLPIRPPLWGSGGVLGVVPVGGGLGFTGV